MKNFKRILSVIIIDFIYGLLTFFFLFVVAEYIHDVFTDFARFKFMHSFTDNIYVFVGSLGWILFTIFIIKYNKKIIIKLK